MSQWWLWARTKADQVSGRTGFRVRPVPGPGRMGPMWKCVVSRCPNRLGDLNRGTRTPKRFFCFPADPGRVQVWLAALRQTDRLGSTERHIICEDHFLPKDVSSSGVSSDAVPIMPPDLDGTLGPWGAGSSEEEEQWTSGGCREDEEAPRQQDRCGGLKDAPTNTSSTLRPGTHLIQTKKLQSKSRKDLSLGLLTQGFLKLLLAAPDGSLDLRHVTVSLNTTKRRVYDITNVLTGISLIQKESTNRIKWVGGCPISCFLWQNKHKMFQRELEKLRQVESTLDGLIKSCAQQLFAMTDNVEDAASAYVTHEDVSRLRAFQEQTLMVVQAPEETKLEVPAPREDVVQVHLKAEMGPIVVMTCEVESGDAVTSDPREESGFFSTLEKSRIRLSALHSGPLRALHSA